MACQNHMCSQASKRSKWTNLLPLRNHTPVNVQPDKCIISRYSLSTSQQIHWISQVLNCTCEFECKMYCTSVCLDVSQASDNVSQSEDISFIVLSSSGVISKE